MNVQPLAAGKYSVWAIPGPETWTLIFSSAADVYHGEVIVPLQLRVP